MTFVSSVKSDAPLCKDTLLQTVGFWSCGSNSCASDCVSARYRNKKNFSAAILDAISSNAVMIVRPVGRIASTKEMKNRHDAYFTSPPSLGPAAIWTP